MEREKVTAPTIEERYQTILKQLGYITLPEERCSPDGFRGGWSFALWQLTDPKLQPLIEKRHLSTRPDVELWLKSLQGPLSYDEACLATAISTRKGMPELLKECYEEENSGIRNGEPDVFVLAALSRTLRADNVDLDVRKVVERRLSGLSTNPFYAQLK